jgi:hypothetical protein
MDNVQFLLCTSPWFQRHGLCPGNHLAHGTCRCSIRTVSPGVRILEWVRHERPAPEREHTTSGGLPLSACRALFSPFSSRTFTISFQGMIIWANYVCKLTQLVSKVLCCLVQQAQRNICVEMEIGQTVPFAAREQEVLYHRIVRAVGKYPGKSGNRTLVHQQSDSEEESVQGIYRPEECPLHLGPSFSSFQRQS